MFHVYPPSPLRCWSGIRNGNSDPPALYAPPLVGLVVSSNSLSCLDNRAISTFLTVSAIVLSPAVLALSIPLSEVHLLLLFPLSPTAPRPTITTIAPLQLIQSLQSIQFERDASRELSIDSDSQCSCRSPFSAPVRVPVLFRNVFQPP